MEYKGKLYGKVGDNYIPLEATTDDIEKMQDAIEIADKLVIDLHFLLANCTFRKNDDASCFNINDIRPKLIEYRNEYIKKRK